MNFNNILPDWRNEGSEPSSGLQATGFQPGYKPPANVFNWFWSKVSKAIKEIQEILSEVEEKKTEIKNIGILNGHRKRI